MNADTPDQMEIGSRLRSARVTLGIKQEDAASYLGIPRTAIVSIEAGRRRITATELAELASLYRRSVDWLLGRSAESEFAGSVLYRLASELSESDQQRILDFAQALAQSGKPTK